MTRLLQKMEGYTYKSTGMGAQVRFEFRGGQPFANVWVGINMNEMADLAYETSFLITAPVSMGKDGKFSLGDFRYVLLILVIWKRRIVTKKNRI